MRNVWQGQDYRCQCGVVIEVYEDMIINGYTGKEVEIEQQEGDFVTVIIPEGVTPYYKSDTLVLGRDPDGRDVEVKDGKAIGIFSINQKIAAYEEALELGFPVVAEKLGIDVSTLKRWKTVKRV